MNNKELWVKSPITGKDMVMQEFDEKNGVSKIDLSSGYYTNEYPLNYKKHPNFDINEYESGMPDVVKLLKHDDGESYWYPSTIQTDESFVFPTIKEGENIKWCWAPVSQLTKKEKNIYSSDIDYESKVDMENAEYFDNYLDACKKVNGFALGNL
tara:strand:+ start:705 stop:1166 length:462 start_codon:yes stop_codon:yes gene_type:complete